MAKTKELTKKQKYNEQESYGSLQNLWGVKLALNLIILLALVAAFEPTEIITDPPAAQASLLMYAYFSLESMVIFFFYCRRRWTTNILNVFAIPLLFVFPLGTIFAFKHYSHIGNIRSWSN